MKILTYLLLVAAWCGLAGRAAGQTLHTLEYFIDTDPGVGLATPVDFTGANSVSVSYDLDLTPAVLAPLARGLHQVGVRAKDSDGKWCATSVHLFFYDGQASGRALHTLEYFIDTDPGVGLATPVDFTAANAASVSYDLDLTPAALAPLNLGLHQVGVRGKDSEGKWCATSIHLFFYDGANAIPDLTSFAWTIQRSGFDSGPQITGIIPPGQSVVRDFDALVAGLQANTPHTFTLRAVDSNGREGIPATIGFTPFGPGVHMDDSFDDGNTGTGPSMTWNTAQTTGTSTVTETGGELIWTTPAGGTNFPNRGVVSDTIYPAPGPGETYVLDVEYGLMTVTTARNGRDLVMEANFISANAPAGTNRAQFFSAHGSIGMEIGYDSAPSGFHTRLAMLAKNDTVGTNISPALHQAEGNRWNASTQTGSTRLYMNRTHWAMYANSDLVGRGPLSLLGLGTGPGEEFGNGFRVCLFSQSDGAARGVMRLRRATLTCVPTASLSAPGWVEEDVATAVSFSATGISAADEVAGYTFNGLFGDGGTLSDGPGATGLRTLSHTWANPGLNLVTLTATQQHGIPSEPLQRPVLVTPAGFSGEIYRDDFDNGNPLTNSQHGMTSPYLYSGVVPALTESGGTVSVNLTDASLPSFQGRALETADVFPPPAADKAYVITWDVAPFTVTAQGSSLYDMGAEFDVISAREGNQNPRQSDSYRGMLECGVNYDGAAGAVNHTTVFTRRRGASDVERNVLHLGQAINPFSGAIGGQLRLELTRTGWRYKSGAIVLSEGMLADIGMGFESGQPWDEGFRLRSMFFKVNTGGGTGSLNSLAVSLVSAASLNPPQEIVPLGSASPGFLSATDYAAGAAGLNGEYWREAAATTPTLSNAPIACLPGGLLDQRVFTGAPLGTFTATAVNYAGVDTTPIATFLGADGASYAGTSNTLDNGIFRLRGYLRITQPDTVLDYFGIRSDDGSYLRIAGLELSNDSNHGEFTRARRIRFTVPGFYPVEARWYNQSNAGLTGGAALRIGMATVAGTPSGILTATVSPVLPAGVSFVKSVEPTLAPSPLVFEGFDTPAGSGQFNGRQGETSRGWNGPWTTAVNHIPADIIAGSLVPPSETFPFYTLPTRGNHAFASVDTTARSGKRRINASFSGSTLYGSFLADPEGIESTIAIPLQDRELVFTAGFTAAGLAWGVGAGPSYWPTVNSTQDGVELVIFQLDYNVSGPADHIRVWIDKDPLTTSPDVDQTEDLGNPGFGFVDADNAVGPMYFRGYFPNGGATMRLDEFRLGTSLESVIGLPRLASSVSAPATAAAGVPQTVTLNATHAILADQAAGFTWALNFGDGTTGTVSPLAASPHNVAHTWAAAGTYTITATPTDRNGYAGPPATTSIEIIMPPLPEIARTGAAALTVNEGSLAANAGTFSDPQGAATAMVSATVGTLTQDNGAGTWAWNYTPPDGPAGPVTVTVSAMDDSIPPNVATTTFTLEVLNVAPTAAGQTLTVLEDSGATAITLVASDPGADTQMFSIVTPPAAVLGTLGAVSGNAVSFTPAADANGAASFTFTATDSDGAASAAATVDVNITPVNDAPTFTKGLDQARPPLTDSAQTVPGWASTISAGATDEAAQVLTFSVSVTSGAALFTTPPALSSTGTLTFTPTGVSGTAVMSVTLADDGGTANGGSDTSAAQMFSITLATAGPEIAIEQPAGNPLGGSLAAWGYNVQGQTDVPAGVQNFAQVAGGQYFTLALRSDGTVTAWGHNAHQQCDVPAGLTGVVAVSAGARHSMALKSDGTVVAWGFNTNGQTDVPVGLANVIAIAAGGHHCMALKADGTVEVWGSNSHSQREVPPSLSAVTKIAAYGDHCLALKVDGTVAAWGANNSGQTVVPAGLSGVTSIASGYGHCLAAKSDGTVVAWGLNDFLQTDVPAGLSGVIALASGGWHSLALKSDRTVVAWGYDSAGQATPPVLTGVSAIAAGEYHSLALHGQRVDFGAHLITSSAARTFTIRSTGTGPLALSSVSVPGGNAADFAVSAAGIPGSLAAGSAQTFTVTFAPSAVGPRSTTLRVVSDDADEGTLDILLTGEGLPVPEIEIEQPAGLPLGGIVEAWGYNAQGQKDVPDGLSNVIAIAGGQYFSLTLLNDGTIQGWGHHAYGQINIPNNLLPVAAISAGARHSMALQNNGTVRAWGYNTNGQTDVPAGLTNVIAIDAGGNHCLALKNDGTVAAWGSQSHSQSTVPPGLSGVIAISACGDNSMALKNDGTVVCWGGNHQGQANVPAGLNEVVGIANGYGFSVALKSNGSIVSWGANDYGQRDVPAGLGGVTAIACGGWHTVALKNDGTVIVWGLNESGQASVPAGLTGVTAIAAGEYHTLALRGHALEFGLQNVSTTGAAEAFTIRNTGSGPLAVSTVSVTGGEAADFAVSAAGIPASVPAGGSVSFAVTFTPSATGTRSTMLRITSDDADEGTLDIALSGFGGTPLQSWRERHFGSSANAGQGADDADPDKDGVTNIVEHALLGDPHSDSQSGLPAGQAMVYSEGKRLTLEFERSAGHSDITIYVEASGDLDGTWTELACSVHGAPFTGPGTVSETASVPGTALRRVTVRDVENMEDKARRFTRVRVTGQ